ncbi:MAG: phosphoserine phosphatase SerB [Aquiluna sp.]|nr:phosphoserine phosphatase SerB [Aquiluna sp.]
MSKHLVVFDVDSTLIEEEAIELLAEFSGTREQVAEITARAMAGEIDFGTSLVERVSLLEGLSESVLAEVAASLTPTKGAQELISLIHETDGYAAAVSGGFIQLLGPLKKQLGLDFAKANTLEVVDGKLTGKITGELVDSTVKAETLLALVHKLEIENQRTIAIGDGANDLTMMKVAGLSIAFCAKQIVRDQADVVLDVRDLSLVAAFLPNG